MLGNTAQLIAPSFAGITTLVDPISLAGFPATGSSTLDSRIAKFLKLYIAVTNFRATDRIMLQDYIELLPVDTTTLTSCAQHFPPVTTCNF
ncbi:MAG: hypothetical protein H7318_04285 [Oligoflexus sp.]|nr:hypothetical protein [Oligoflexus sp.]